MNPLTIRVELAGAPRRGEVDLDAGPLSIACETFRNEGVRFIVDGFGQRWPVDVATDLMVVLEQLPRVLRELKESTETVLEFYEQGIERTLTISPLGRDATVACMSMTSWVPQPNSISMPKDDLARQLRGLAANACSLMRQFCPQLEHTEEFQQLEQCAVDR